MNDILEGYAAAATSELIARFEAISPSRLYEHVADLLPVSPVRVVDIGAGTGRDAAWLAERGHEVLAIEPVDALRNAGSALHGSPRSEWLSDQLPELTKTRQRGRFDLLLLIAVWQHLDSLDQQRAIVSLAELTAPQGTLIMSLRRGPGAPGRRVFPSEPQAIIHSASQAGFSLIRRVDAESVQLENRANDVRWTWLALGAG